MLLFPGRLCLPQLRPLYFGGCRHSGADVGAVMRIGERRCQPKGPICFYLVMSLTQYIVDALIGRPGVGSWQGQGTKQLDLGSLKASGATWLLQTSEDSELVRRRGRWLNSRTMRIYIQEVFSSQFVSCLRPPVRKHIFELLEDGREVGGI